MVIPSMYLQMFLSQSFLVLDTDSFWSSSGVACSSCSCMEAQPNWVFNFIEISLCNVTPRPGDSPHSWTRSPLRVPSNSNTSMILWYFDSHPGLPLGTLKSRLPWAAHSCFLSFLFFWTTSGVAWQQGADLSLNGTFSFPLPLAVQWQRSILNTHGSFPVRSTAVRKDKARSTNLQSREIMQLFLSWSNPCQWVTGLSQDKG